MIEIIQKFIIDFIEVITLIILLTNLAFKEKSNNKMDILIAFISTVAMEVIDGLNIAYMKILVYVIIVFLVKYFYKISLIKAIFNFSVAVVFFGIFQMIIIKALIIIGIQYENKKLFDFIGVTTVLIIVVLMNKYVFNDKYRRFNIMLNFNSNIILCFIVNLGTYCIITKLIWEYDKNLMLDNLIVVILVSIGIFIVNMFLYWYITRITEEKKILEVERQFEPILEDIIEEIRRKQHDFKNHLNAINGIINTVDEKEMKVQLEKYMSSLNLYNKDLDCVMYIDNIAVRATVYNKLCEAERLDIKFSFNIHNHLMHNILNDYEITDILNNLINNAFEAVLNTDNKEVILNILSEENTTTIEVKNSGIKIKPEDLGRIFKRGFSTKGENRGYGLYNIKKIVEHSGGKIEVSSDDNYTTFRVLFKQTFREEDSLL